MNISIILRTKNEGRFIGKTLDLIKCQAYAGPVEVIVVDSGSSDDTLAIVRGHDTVRILELPPAEFTYGRSLNIGARAACGELLVSLSAHAFPCDESWLARLTRHFYDTEVAGVYSKQIPQPEAWPWVKRDYSEFYGEAPRIQTDIGNVADHVFSNAASAIRRSLWEKRAFNEALPYCEDWEWARAMLGLGFKIVYDPSAPVFHSHNESLMAVYRRCANEVLAQQMLYSVSVQERKAWYQIWREAVTSDVQYIIKTGGAKHWLLRATIHRLFWAIGRSSAPHHEALSLAKI